MAAKFETARTYSCRSICDYNCVFSFEVVKRTASTVTLKARGKETRRKVFADADGVEWLFPLGQYSMAPVLRAA